VVEHEEWLAEHLTSIDDDWIATTLGYRESRIFSAQTTSGEPSVNSLCPLRQLVRWRDVKHFVKKVAAKATQTDIILDFSNPLKKSW
jgi:hypothetical protein